MYDKELVSNSLKQIQQLLDTIIERTEEVKGVDDFLSSPSSMVLLDAICMNLISVGEAVKNLDKLTEGRLLSKYTEIPWGGIMRMRDKIAHHYFEIDAEMVLLTVKDDIPQVKKVIERIIIENRLTNR